MTTRDPAGAAARSPLKLFALEGSRGFVDHVARELGLALAAHEVREFEDGEHKLRPLENVRGADVYVIASLHADGDLGVDEKLVRLLFFAAALKDGSAARVTLVVPYLCYARKDRRTKPRDPVSSRYVAAMIEATGADAILTLDVHNVAAYQNAFRIPADHLEARTLFADHLAAMLDEAPVVVVSPDVGGVKRAEALATIVGCAPLFAAAIRRMHDGGSLVELLDQPAPR